MDDNIKSSSNGNSENSNGGYYYRNKNNRGRNKNYHKNYNRNNQRPVSSESDPTADENYSGKQNNNRSHSRNNGNYKNKDNFRTDEKRSDDLKTESSNRTSSSDSDNRSPKGGNGNNGYYGNNRGRNNRNRRKNYDRSEAKKENTDSSVSEASADSTEIFKESAARENYGAKKRNKRRSELSAEENNSRDDNVKIYGEDQPDRELSVNEEFPAAGTEDAEHVSADGASEEQKAASRKKNRRKNSSAPKVSVTAEEDISENEGSPDVDSEDAEHVSADGASEEQKAASRKKNRRKNSSAPKVSVTAEEDISEDERSEPDAKEDEVFAEDDEIGAAFDFAEKTDDEPVIYEEKEEQLVRGGEEKPEIKDEASDYRRKSETRFWGRFFSLIAIIPVYFAFVICMIALPRSTISNIERRTLATFPEFSWSDYWSGKYTSDITNYFDDTVPFRDTLKQAGSRFSNLLGIKYNDVQVSGQMQVVNKQNDDPVKESSTDSEKNFDGSISNESTHGRKTDTDSEENPAPKGQEIADGVYTNGTIVIYQDGHYRAMSMYGGGTGDAYVNSVNNFADDLPGVQVYSMVDPTTSEFYTPLNFSDYNASQSDDIDSMNERLSNKVIGINVCSTMAKHVNEPIYTRTDHHWQSLGAYYAVQRFAKEAGVPVPDIKNYQKKSESGYVGTLYAFSGGNADLLNDPEDFVYYVPKNDYSVEYYDYAYNYQFDGDLFSGIYDISEAYSSIIYGDAFTVKIKTGVKNGRKLCLVKDSYGNALAPFFTYSFEEIYVVDMRYLQVNLVDFVEERGITDLLFSCCSYSAVGPNADNLEFIRTMGGSAPSDDKEESHVSEEQTGETREESVNETVSEETGQTYEEDFGENLEPGLYVGDDDGGGENNDAGNEDYAGGDEEYGFEDIEYYE